MVRPANEKKHLNKTPLSKASEGEKPKRRYRRRKRVKSEVRKLQRTTHLLNSKASFEREVRKTLADINPQMRITKNALAAIQEASETALTELLMSANTIAVGCAGRAGPLLKDMKAALHIGHPHLSSKF